MQQPSDNEVKKRKRSSKEGSELKFYNDDSDDENAVLQQQPKHAKTSNYQQNGNKTLKTAAAQIGVHWDLLPEEIFYVVFQFCDAKNLDRLRQVCKKFNKLALDQNLWLYLCLSSFHPYSFDPRFYFFNFKTCYIDLHKRRVTYVDYLVPTYNF